METRNGNGDTRILLNPEEVRVDELLGVGEVGHWLRLRGSFLLDRSEAARFLGVKPDTLASWACGGRYHLPVVKVGRLCKYRIDDLVAFVNRSRHGGEEDGQ